MHIVSLVHHLYYLWRNPWTISISKSLLNHRGMVVTNFEEFFFPVTPSLNHIRFHHNTSKAFAVFHVIQKGRFVKFLIVSKLYMIVLLLLCTGFQYIQHCNNTIMITGIKLYPCYWKGTLASTVLYSCVKYEYSYSSVRLTNHLAVYHRSYISQ